MAAPKEKVKDVLTLMREHGVTLTQVIDGVIEDNAIIGVGLITLAEQLSDHVKSKL